MANTKKLNTGTVQGDGKGNSLAVTSFKPNTTSAYNKQTSSTTGLHTTSVKDPDQQIYVHSGPYFVPSNPEQPIKTRQDLIYFSIPADPAKEKPRGWYISGGINIPTRQYELQDVTSEPADEEDIYIKDPYNPGCYIKKHTYRRLIKKNGTVLSADSHITIGSPTYLSTTKNLKYNTVINAFKNNKSFLDDALITLRGEAIEDTVFTKERSKALFESISKLAKKPNGYVYSLKDEMTFATTGMIKIFNFAKAAIELAQQEARHNYSQIYFNRELYDASVTGYKVAFEEKDVSSLLDSKAVSLSNNASNSSSSSASLKRRSIVEKISKASSFPMNKDFAEYFNSVLNSAALSRNKESDDLTINPNQHVNRYSRAVLDNQRTYNRESNHLKILTVNAIRKFLNTNNLVFLKSDFSDSIIKTTVTDNTKEAASLESGANNIYVFNSLLLEPVTTFTIEGAQSNNNSEPDEFSIQSIIDHIIIPHDSMVLGVKNG